MSEQASFSLRGRNPDVLTCIANLSNDEVFTPPDVVNKMLDMLPQELFRNPDTTFLEIIMQKLIQFNDCRRSLQLAG